MNKEPEKLKPAGALDAVAKRLMDEAEVESRTANNGNRPFAQEVLGLYARKLRAYLLSLDRTVH